MLITIVYNLNKKQRGILHMTTATREKILREVYNQMLTYPTKSDRAIALELNLSNSTVSRYRKKLFIRIDSQLARDVSGKFLTAFQMTSDYFMKQIEKLEDLKTQEKTVIFKTKDDFVIQKVPQDPREILEIEKHQGQIWKDFLFICSQGQAIEVIRLIQNGELPALTN